MSKSSDDTLLSPKEIKNALGNGVLKILEILDPYTIERLRKAHGTNDDLRSICWACGGESGYRSIQQAHIIPCEEMGTGNDENIIPLCTPPRLGRSDSPPEQLGCHQLFDFHGALSRSDMAAIRKSGKPNTAARKEMIRNVERARELSKASYGRESKVSEQRKLEQRLKNVQYPYDRFLANVDLANHWRRRPRKDSVKNAWTYITAAEEDLKVVKDHSKRSNFYYQKAYIMTLREKDCKSFHYFRKSIYEAKDGDLQLKADMSTAQFLLVKGMFMSMRDARREAGRKLFDEWKILLRIFHTKSKVTQENVKLLEQSSSETPEMSDALKKARSDLADANRWIQSCHIHRAQLAVKRNLLPLAREELRRWSAFRSGLTILDGWTAAHTPVASIAQGMIAAANNNINPKEMEQSLKILVRGLFMMLRNPQKCPEFIRDGLFALGILLRQYDSNKMCNISARVFEVAKRVHDPLSGVMEDFLCN